ncbi:hypothetical protein Hanom_Chr08g00718571 [Helianthus anomalus]
MFSFFFVSTFPFPISFSCSSASSNLTLEFTVSSLAFTSCSVSGFSVPSIISSSSAGSSSESSSGSSSGSTSISSLPSDFTFSTFSVTTVPVSTSAIVFPSSFCSSCVSVVTDLLSTLESLVFARLTRVFFFSFSEASSNCLFFWFLLATYLIRNFCSA